jgi:hypothetical protein
LHLQIFHRKTNKPFDLRLFRVLLEHKKLVNSLMKDIYPDSPSGKTIQCHTKTSKFNIDDRAEIQYRTKK